MNALDELLSDLKDVCAGLVDKRQGQTCRYTMADIGLGAFSVFFMQSPSFLAHQRTLAAGHGRSNCQTLLGTSVIPSDNHIRQMLDGNTPAAFDGLFVTAVEAVAAAGGLSTFQRLDGRVRDRQDFGGQAAMAKLEARSASALNRWPSPEPSLPLMTAQRTWSRRSAPRRDQRICCALFRRRLTRKLAVPSVIDVPTR